MYIALFIANQEFGGAEKMMLHLAQGFVNRGHKVDIILVGSPNIPLHFGHPEAKIYHLETKRFGLGCFWALRKYLHANHPQILLSTLFKFNIAAVWASKLAGYPIRLVLREANAYPFQSKSQSRFANKLGYLLMLVFYPLADCIVAVAQGTADTIKKGIHIPKGRIKVIFNPTVTPELIQSAALPVDEVWFKNGQAPVVLGVGRFTEQKNFITLIKAFAIVRRKTFAQLVIIGEGDKRHELEQCIKELGMTDDVNLPGFKENPYAYMAKASVFVLSSAWEGLPNVLIEAMACGTSLVATDCVSGPFEILEGGKYGRLVPVGDPAAMAEAILDSLNNPMRKEILQQRANLFSIDCAVSAYLETFQDLINR